MACKLPGTLFLLFIGLTPLPWTDELLSSTTCYVPSTSLANPSCPCAIAPSSTQRSGASRPRKVTSVHTYQSLLWLCGACGRYTLVAPPCLQTVAYVVSRRAWRLVHCADSRGTSRALIDRWSCRWAHISRPYTPKLSKRLQLACLQGSAR